MTSLVGQTIADRFELLAFASAGGMGHVYRARDRATGEPVAVKLLAPDNVEKDRFTREAEILASIEHPGVVRYLAHGETDGGAQYLAMEWLSGEDLGERLQVAGTLSPREAVALARRAADALSAAHARGVIHRDLKPANLFLVGGRLDAPKLLDFGVARGVADSPLTMSGVIVGTPTYMAPEQVRGEPLDARVDVYGLGAVVFRCLAGAPPFRGAHQLAVLAKVVIEPAPPLRDVCPEAPPELAALVARLLAKDPAARPADGGALAAELRALDEGSLSGARRVAAAISAREQRVACVVLCAGVRAEDPTLAEARGAGTEQNVRLAVEERGGAIAPLARGAFIVTVPDAPSPAEHAARAARCALALSVLRPGAPLFVATGRVVVTGEHRVGEVIDRAAAALVEAQEMGRGGGVRVDAATAELLGGRFRIAGDGAWRELVAEEESGTVNVRTLLGKPSPCLGREQQLSMLEATLRACKDEPRACAALVTAPAGVGKSRLVSELLGSRLAPFGDVDVLFAAGDPMRAASPFALAAQFVRRAAGILESDAPDARTAKLAAAVARDVAADDRARLVELLGEIAGLPTPQSDASPALRAARADVSIMADAVREAWIDWIAARAARAMVLLVLEDLHWADAASLRLVEAALAALPDRPVCFLGTARPEPRIGLAERLRPRGLVEVALAPLSRQASERLVRAALGDGAAPELVAAIARRAGGHPFHLEELVRAAAEGRGPDALPDSVLGMVQARLDDLGALPRRVLRAASVFGETFWSGGVAALMGDDLSPTDLAAALASLVLGELVTEERRSKWQGQREYRFRHALLHDAAYAMLAAPDKARAHRRAADWLEAAGERDPAVLAEHYDRGGAADRALGYFRQAASQALSRNDLDRAMSHATRALALGPDAPSEARIRAIEAEILYWRGDLSTAAERAGSSVSRLARGGPEWFEAISVAISADGQLGRNRAVAEWLGEAARAPATEGTRGAQIVAICRGMTQLFWAHHGGALVEARASLDALATGTGTLDPYDAGWVHRVRGESAWLHARDVGLCLAELDLSCDAFERARALRALCLTRLNAASLRGWSGDAPRAMELVARARADAERLGATFLLRYAGVVEGMLRAYAGQPDAEEALRRAAPDVRASPRLSFLCDVVLGWLSLDRGDADTAEQHARAAGQADVADPLRAAARGLASRVALSRGRTADALRLAEEGAGLDARSDDLELTHGLLSLSLVAAQRASGAEGAARATLEAARGRLAALATTIADDEHRRRFLERPLGHAELSHGWGLEVRTAR